MSSLARWSAALGVALGCGAPTGTPRDARSPAAVTVRLDAGVAPRGPACGVAAGLHGGDDVFDAPSPTGEIGSVGLAAVAASEGASGEIRPRPLTALRRTIAGGGARACGAAAR